ncbi:MAG: hypothetical protein SOW71_06530, partial [Eubacteriales bacterium]|nr:hypothetical protein [Eubacteriales bacterium]
KRFIELFYSSRPKHIPYLKTHSYAPALKTQHLRESDLNFHLIQFYLNRHRDYSINFSISQYIFAGKQLFEIPKLGIDF